MEVEVSNKSISIIQPILKEYPRWCFADPISNPKWASSIIGFSPIQAIHYGVQGERKPSVTKNSIEGIICCSSLTASM